MITQNIMLLSITSLSLPFLLEINRDYTVSLLHIEFDKFKGNIIFFWCASVADPQFNVISCGTGQILCKPWRIVELTACAVGHTVLTIPENMYIVRVQYILISPGRV